MKIGKVITIIGTSIVAIVVILVLRVTVPLIWDFIKISSQCDTTDYSPIIKKVAVPMQKELEKFYTENKRFPTTQERDEMLEKVGCKMEGDVCVYGGERLTLIVHYNTRYQYKIRIDLENTGCYFGIQYNGNHTPVSCATSACISLKQ